MPKELLYFLIFLVSHMLMLFTPKYGFFALKKRYKKQRERKSVENSLKHLYHCEHNKKNCTVSSLSESMQMKEEKTKVLIEKLMAQGLTIYDGENIRLTEQGRNYAVHIIRTHRLWETYLAAETEVAETDWHRSAEQMEHFFTPEQTTYLDAKLGHPLYDPHGDPIPDISGETHEEKARELGDCKEGDLVKVTHIEDEPDNIYRMLLSKGLKAGVIFRILEKSGELVRIHVNGKQVKLTEKECRNLSVKIYEESAQENESFRTLDSLKPGSRSKIRSISKTCRGQQRKRLMDLGVIPGTEIQAEFISASGDPVAYTVKGTTIALRKNLAEKIYIEETK